MPKTADEIFNDKVKALLNAEKALALAVNRHQQSLYTLILSEYLPLFEIVDGVIVDSIENIGLINQIDNYFDKLQKALERDILSPFAASLLDNASLSSQYYIALGFRKSVVNELLRNKINLEAKLGITPTGKVKVGSYLQKLGQTEQVRNQLKKYVIDSLTGDVSFLDFQLGFRNLVIGNKRVKALAVKGSLEKYFDQYAIDTFSQVDAATNRQFAVGLNLNHFIYEGSLIDTSRVFCEKRAGKAFSVNETKKWKDDPDLIDKKTKASYRPLVDRGRYRCRHFIKYITEELYNKLK